MKYNYNYHLMIDRHTLLLELQITLLQKSFIRLVIIKAVIGGH